jgi:hypothetical protein
MRYLKLLLILFTCFTFLISCKNKLNVNADWQDITVVYGLMNQNDTVHYLKITKAFLGEGDALKFAKIPDSSFYPNKLDVRIEEWQSGNLVKTLYFDTTTEIKKEAGDSIFYFPYQLVYKNNDKLNETSIYKLFIKNPKTGKETTSQTPLVGHLDVKSPVEIASARAGFDTIQDNDVSWYAAKNGAQYQLVIRFHYTEILITDTSKKTQQYIDWTIFTDEKALDTTGVFPNDYTFPGKGFYLNVGHHVPVNHLVYRLAGRVDYIFTVAAGDLSTYMQVNEPSTTIVQEKPFFTNITNGIGLFSSRYDRTISLLSSDLTKQCLKYSSYTYMLGF